jgi:ABC-type bacteriocin/lantibiotic exporter with double-glycine peptidase domain
MKWLQTLIVLIFSIFLLMYLWPVLLILLAVIGYQFFKASRIVKQAVQDASQNDTQEQYQTFKQDSSGDVIDADYTERSSTDGPQ